MVNRAASQAYAGAAKMKSSCAAEFAPRQPSDFLGGANLTRVGADVLDAVSIDDDHERNVCRSVNPHPAQETRTMLGTYRA